MKHGHAPAPPEAARAVFGDRLSAAVTYADLLVTDGVERGLIGPREHERIWERHILNSAALGELLDDGERVVDVGSGAGLPGIPIAIARPGVRLILVEPMLRRTVFLEEAVREMALDAVVVRGRAESPATVRQAGSADAVVSRAVGPLDKLTRWCVPLMRPGGTMLALKGEQAEAELETHRRVMERLGVGNAKVVKCGHDYLDPPATVVMARKAERNPRTPNRPDRRRPR